MRIRKDTEKIIIGIDPGTNVTGYAVIAVVGSEVQLLQYSVIELSKLENHALKLQKIFQSMLRLIEEYKPDEMALEAPFYGKNIQSMLKLGRAQGVAMAAALYRDIPLVEYAPKKVKQVVTGNGNASKEQVAKMLSTLLKTELDHSFFDATDALAVAVCHHFSKGNAARRSGSWKSFLTENPGRLVR